MPQAIPAFINWAGTQAAVFLMNAFGMSASTALFVVNAGIKLAGLAILGELSKSLVDIPDLNNTAANNLITTRGTIENQRIIYGEVLVSGPLWYLNSAGTHNQSLYHAVVVAGHEVEDITDVWLDDNQILSASIDWSGDGSVDSYWPRGNTAYATTAYFDKKLGAEDQTAQTDLVSAFTEITANHRGRGIAYLTSRFDYFENQTQVWSAGVPQAIRALVKGKKVYDPRSDTTQSFGTGPHRVNDSSTWEWSDNPALCWADYMIDSQHGFGEVSSRIDYGYVASAAEWCDETVYLPDDPGPGGTDKRYRCNGTLSTGNTHKANLESILSSANMTMVLVQGQWKLRPFSFETPTLQFTDDDLRGDIRIQLTSQAGERYNSVRGTFVDKSRQYQPHSFPTFVSTEYIWRDNSESLIKDIQLPMTTDGFMAQRLAAGILEQSDLQTTVVYPSNFKTLPVEIGGTVAITNSKMGWSEKPFRVTNYKLSDMQGIDLLLREEAATAYTDVGTAEYIVRSGGVYITNDPGVPAPTSFYVNNVPNGIQLFWTNPPARLFEFVDIYRHDSPTFTGAELIKHTRNDTYLDKDLTAGQWFYWLQAVNFAGELSDVVPDLTGVNSIGLEGLHLIKTQLIQDPSFELTPINTRQTESNGARFWGGVDTPFEVRSSGTATGGTNHLNMFKVVVPNTTQLMGNPYGIDWFNIVRGMDLQVYLRWRVTSSSNVNTAYMDLPVAARQSLRNTTGETISSPRISLHNTATWQVYSSQLDQATFSNVDSYSVARFGFKPWVRTLTNTGSINLEIDEIYVAFVP